jgi:hypothetical protein
MRRESRRQDRQDRHENHTHTGHGRNQVNLIQGPEDAGELRNRRARHLGTPGIRSSYEIRIMPPIPQEKPETTACGTRMMWRPTRSGRTR